MNRLLAGGFAASFVAAVMVGAAATAAVPSKAAAPWQEAHAQRDVIRGTFTQRKYLPELDQPLVSSGRFVVAAGHGLFWQIEQPVQVQLVITQEQLLRRSNGHEIARTSAEEQPALRVVASVLLAVFQADMDALRQVFKIQKQSLDNGHWSMTLRPAGAGALEFIQSVRIRGAAHIEQIEIRQPEGDYSVIDLDAATAAPPTLSAQERALFRN